MMRVVVCILILTLVPLSSCQTNQRSNPVVTASPTASTQVKSIVSSITPVPSRPTSVAGQSPHPKPTSTPSPAPQVSFQGPVVAFNQLSESLWLYDLGTQSGRRLTFKDGYPNNAQWTTNACQLYVTLVDPVNSKTTIVRTDLHGNVQEQVFQMSVPPTERHSAYRGHWSVSPAGEWVAYISFSGEQYYAGSEFQDIVAVNRNNLQQFITLTVRHGGLSYAWSPEGQRVAFADYDVRGIRQIYIAHLNRGQKTQLTDFPDQEDARELSKDNIGQIAWSPDGKTVAVHERKPNAQSTNAGSVWLFSVDGNRRVRIATTNLQSVLWLGWSDDSATLAFYGRPDIVSGDALATIYWVRAADGKVLRILSAAELPELSYSSAFSFRDTRLLGITSYLPEGRSYAYDYQSKSLTPILVPDLVENPDFIEVVSTPTDFPGEEACAQLVH